MAKCLIFILLFFLNTSSFCQLPNGSIAPDFDVEDLNGNTYSLYAMMGSNKSACIGFEATWCGFCWHFHLSGVLSEVYNNLSANTTVIMLESDFATNTECLYGPTGCNNYTQGDWVTGTPYPIANLSPSNGPDISSDYSRNYYPTLYVISPDKRCWEIIERTYQNYFNWITKSFALNVTASLTHSTCGDNGKIALNTTGGYGIIKYKWTNGASTKDLNNISGGTYSVTVTDANSYFKVYGPFVINGPDKRVDVTNSYLTHIKCYNGTTGNISIQLDYGTPPYLLNWSNGSKTSFIDNLKAGNYFLTVTDKNGCSRIKSYNLTQPNEITVSMVTNKDNCDSLNGYIKVFAAGGQPPYIFNRGDGDQTDPEFRELVGGRDYKIKITDNNGCSTEIVTTVDVTHRPKVEAGNDLLIDCKIASLNLDGGNSDDGPGFSILWSTKTGEIIKGAKSLVAKVSKPGIYYLQITNLNNKCIAVDSVFIKDGRVFPDIHAAGDTTLNCRLTETMALGNSSHAPIYYFWLKAEDSLFIDTSKSLFVNVPGSYIFNVKDTLNLCVAKDTVFIKSDKSLPDAIAYPSGNIGCINKEVMINALASSQGSQYVYRWTTINGNIISGGNSLSPVVNKAGSYILEVENVLNYCVNSTEVEVYEETTPLAEFHQRSNGLKVNFIDNSIGHPLIWKWSFGDGAFSNEQHPEHTYLIEGEFLICLSVENGCGQNVNCKNILVDNSGVQMIILDCPEMVSETLCPGTDSLNYKFSEWLKTATFSGGCDSFLINNANGPPDVCGGSKMVTFTVKSSCGDSITCSSIFEVETASPVDLKCPDILIEEAGQSQDTIDSKFQLWLASLSLSGGCFTEISDNNTGAPAHTGGVAEVTFNVNSNCEPTVSCISTFMVRTLTSNGNPSDITWFNRDPNPVYDLGKVVIQFNKETNYHLNLINIYGESVWQTDAEGIQNIFTLNTSSFSKGLYILVLSTPYSQNTLKWILD